MTNTMSYSRGLWRTPGSSTDLRRGTPPAIRVPRREAFVAAPLFACAVLAALLAAALLLPAAAGAQPATGPESFNLSFSIGQQGRSGCFVCHSDRNLKRLSAGRQRSFYISEEVVERSAHRTVSCLGCHLDFNFDQPHGEAVKDFRAVAGLACRNCHARAYDLYQQGVHGTRLKGNPKSPTCADCHGSHDIMSITKDAKARRELHARGYQVCGRCHQRYWDNYDDYYHGAAYKRGAADAPACWQCHRPHDVYNSKNAESAVSKQNLAVTCGACHEGVRQSFLAYTKLIHGGATVRERNVVLRYYEQFRATVGSAFTAIARQVRAVFG